LGIVKEPAILLEEKGEEIKLPSSLSLSIELIKEYAEIQVMNMN
jgi:hypothetical protein